MRHPFELEISDLEAVNFNSEAELTDEETTKINGGLLTRGLWEAGGYPCRITFPLRPPIKPPIATTLALGEEGGCARPPLARQII